MKINRFAFQNNHLEIEDDVDFSHAKLDPNHIRKIENTHVKITANEYDDLLCVEFDISCDVTGVCSYTLQDVPMHLHFKDSLEFSNEINDDEDIIYEDKPIFEIDDYVLQLIIGEVPIKIIKKGAKLPESGTDYRVISEEEYLKEKSEKKDSRWSKLDDIEL